MQYNNSGYRLNTNSGQQCENHIGPWETSMDEKMQRMLLGLQNQSLKFKVEKRYE